MKEKKVTIIGTDAIFSFGFKKDRIYETCPCPESESGFIDDVWVYSEKRKTPVRLLEGEYIVC